MHLFFYLLFSFRLSRFEKWFILNDDVWKIVLAATLRLDHKYNIRDKTHTLASYLNSLWCFDGINEKEYEYTTLQNRMYLKSLLSGYTQWYRPKILKKRKIHDLKSSIGLPQNGLDWKTIRDILILFCLISHELVQMMLVFEKFISL